MKLPTSGTVAAPRVAIEEGIHDGVIIAMPLTTKGSPSGHPYVTVEVALTTPGLGLPTINSVVSFAPNAAFAWDQLCEATGNNPLDEDPDSDNFVSKPVKVVVVHREWPKGSGTMQAEIQRFHHPDFAPESEETTAYNEKRSGLLDDLRKQMGDAKLNPANEVEEKTSVFTRNLESDDLPL
jgi:hypothetical protein